MNSCVYIVALCIQNCFLRCFNSSPFHKSYHKCFAEVVFYCKSGHVLYVIVTYIDACVLH